MTSLKSDGLPAGFYKTFDTNRDAANLEPCFVITSEAAAAGETIFIKRSGGPRDTNGYS